MCSAQYVLLFLVQFNNSDRFQIYVVAHSSLAGRSYALLVHVIQWRRIKMENCVNMAVTMELGVGTGILLLKPTSNYCGLSI